MNVHAQAYVEKYLRTYQNVFTVRDMLKVFSSVGIRTSLRDVKDFLDKKISAQSENEPVRNFYWMESEVVVMTVEEETDVIVTTDPSTPNL